jgi:hypothetical protein
VGYLDSLELTLARAFALGALNHACSLILITNGATCRVSTHPIVVSIREIAEVLLQREGDTVSILTVALHLSKAEATVFVSPVGRLSSERVHGARVSRVNLCSMI